ncbi:hypothetical protein HGM15179_019359, partial [Zosterops borbonicus]
MHKIKGKKGQVTRAEILQEGLWELLNVLFSNPVDNNLMCAVKLLKLTGSVLEDAWKEKGKNDMEEMIQRIENVVLDANCSRDVKHMLLKVVELRSSNWGRVHETSPYTKASPENDPNYFMNEPTFYTSDGVPFTAADPDYQEKYQELLEREYLFPDYEENGMALSGAGDQYFNDLDNKMDPEIEEAYEKFCLESEHKRKQTRSDHGGDWKEAIFASTATHHMAIPIHPKKPRALIKHPPPSSEDENSDSSDANSESEDRWAKTQREATQEGDWELANKISAFPILFKREKRTMTPASWEPIPYGELKEL